MTQVQYHEFLVVIKKVMEVNPTWRYGQALFNTLSTVRPDLSEKLRGTTLDPFHRTLDDINPKMWAFLMENW